MLFQKFIFISLNMSFLPNNVLKFAIFFWLGPGQHYTLLTSEFILLNMFFCTLNWNKYVCGGLLFILSFPFPFCSPSFSSSSSPSPILSRSPSHLPYFSPSPSRSSSPYLSSSSLDFNYFLSFLSSSLILFQLNSYLSSL